MRIGEFAQVVSASIDTVRHYMDLGLIVPERQGAFFYFDKRCQRDFKRVIELKEMGFSLVEIKNMLLIVRFSKMASELEINHYQNFFRCKHDELLHKRQELDNQIQSISEKIERFKSSKVQKMHTIGFGLDALQLLRCPSCQCALNLDQANIEQNVIISGQLSCTCGYQAELDDGIFVDRQSMKRIIESDDSYFIRFIKQNSSEYLDNIYKAMEWGYRQIEEDKIEVGTVVELGVGNGIFLSHVIKALPETTRYIAIDYDLNRLRYIKKMLERIDYQVKVNFICCDFATIPLKHHSFDFVVDFYGSSSYQFNHDIFLHDLLADYYTDSCGLMGIFMCVDKFKRQSLLSENAKQLFKRDEIKRRLMALSFKASAEHSHTYHATGEDIEEINELSSKIVNYGFYGSRHRKKE